MHYAQPVVYFDPITQQYYYYDPATHQFYYPVPWNTNPFYGMYNPGSYIPSPPLQQPHQQQYYQQLLQQQLMDSNTTVSPTSSPPPTTPVSPMIHDTGNFDALFDTPLHEDLLLIATSSPVATAANNPNKRKLPQELDAETEQQQTKQPRLSDRDIWDELDLDDLDDLLKFDSESKEEHWTNAPTFQVSLWPITLPTPCMEEVCANGYGSIVQGYSANHRME